jgi:hypothetical protein
MMFFWISLVPPKIENLKLPKYSGARAPACGGPMG